MMRVRMVRPDAIGIQISSTEHVMSVSEADDLIEMINRAKHEGARDRAAKALDDYARDILRSPLHWLGATICVAAFCEAIIFLIPLL